MALTNFSSQAPANDCIEAGICHVHGEQLESMSRAHAAEVLTLRRRIVALEHALQAATFSNGKAPAVVEADRSGEGVVHDACAAQTAQQPHAPVAGNPMAPAEATEPSAPIVSVPTPMGAEAWDDGDASFSERVAARAFFREDPADEPSRRWFLRND